MKYCFGEFTLDTGTGSLTGPQGPISLRRQTFRLLEVLLEHAPELVDHNSLLDEAWGRTALSPNVLPQAISELRQALGDQAQSPRYIETLHRRGYRIICPVKPSDDKTRRDDQDPPGPRAQTAGPTMAKPEAPARWLVTTTALLVLLVLSISFLWWQESADRRWLERDVLPRIEALVETDVAAAWRLAREARQRVRHNPQLDQLWLDISLPAELHSSPEGARVEVRAYQDANAPWVELGRTPLEDIRLPLAQLRLRASLEGHVPIDAAPSLLPMPETLRLHRPEDSPEGMVFIPGGQVTYYRERRQVPEFWIARHEVTNREYLAFVEDGGYARQEFWLEPALVDDRELSFQELTARLVDQTGMPGPATWKLGTYPEGLGDHPVNGISWFEAMAYARWAGKQLPTVFHWYRAAGLGTAQAANFSGILDASNFPGAAPCQSARLTVWAPTAPMTWPAMCANGA
jgi:DNA-binding winged helix-turn-helix (wHTH) protein